MSRSTATAQVPYTRSLTPGATIYPPTLSRGVVQADTAVRRNNRTSRQTPVQKSVLLRVMPMPGEATRYYCESGSLQCIKCGKLFNRRLKPQLRIGGPCPGSFPVEHHTRIHVPCDGTLDVRFHIVDIASYSAHGACTCEFFDITMRPLVEAESPEEQGMGKHRCSHIDAVRHFALDLTILAHVRDQHAGANGQTEENQP